MTEEINTVVIGAGHAGLAASYCLSQHGVEHVVLECGRVAERWRTERWDSLVFQFPNWSLQLPGHSYRGAYPHGYASKDEFITFLEGYASVIAAPIRCSTEAIGLREAGEQCEFLVETSAGVIQARNVVVATGPFQAPKIPSLSRDLPPDLVQLHARDYRNPDQLPPGAVLVVGSGASGTQIADELNRKGRKVYLAVGRFHKTPRRYRGQDFYWWFDKLGYWHTPLASMPPDAKNLRFVVTAVDGGYDVDLRKLAAEGIVLAGRLKGVDQHKLVFHDDLPKTLTDGDTWYATFIRQMDVYADQCQPRLPEDVTLPAGRSSALPDPEGQREIDIRASEISSVVWASGYTCDFSWIRIPILDANGDPIHQRGITKRAGLYFLGLRRTYSLGSALVAGAINDAAYIADHIASRQADATIAE